MRLTWKQPNSRTVLSVALSITLAAVLALGFTHTPRNSTKKVSLNGQIAGTVIQPAVTLPPTTLVPATTTTLAHPARVRASRAAVYTAKTLPDGRPCPWRDPRYCWSDDVWAVLSACEAGMNPRNTKAAPNYWGAFQFSLGTWHGIGESGNPIDYSYEHQKAAAQRLQARSGWGQWPTCSRKLGLR